MDETRKRRRIDESDDYATVSSLAVASNKKQRVDTNVTNNTPVLRRSSRKRSIMTTKTPDTFSLVTQFLTPTSTIKKKVSVVGKENLSVKRKPK